MFVRGVDCFSVFAIFRLNFGVLCSKAIRDRKVIVFFLFAEDTV